MGGRDLGHARFGEIKSPPGRAACAAPWGAPSWLLARPCSAAVPSVTFPVTCLILAGAVDPAPPSKVGSCPLVATGHPFPDPQDARHQAHRSVRLLVLPGQSLRVPVPRTGGTWLRRQLGPAASCCSSLANAKRWLAHMCQAGRLRRGLGDAGAVGHCGSGVGSAGRVGVPGASPTTARCQVGAPGGGQPRVPWGCSGATHAVGAQGAVWGWGRHRAGVPIGAG